MKHLMRLIERLDNWPFRLLLLALSTLVVFVYGVANDVWLARPEKRIALEAVILAVVLGLGLRVTQQVAKRMTQHRARSDALRLALSLRLPETLGNHPTYRLYLTSYHYVPKSLIRETPTFLNETPIQQRVYARIGIHQLQRQLTSSKAT